MAENAKDPVYKEPEDTEASGQASNETQDADSDRSRISTKDDQRLVRRIFAHWKEWCLGDEFPRRADIYGDIFGRDWADCFILDSQSKHPFPVFQYLGENLAKYSGVFLSGEANWTQTILDKATDSVCEVLDKREPVVVEEELLRYDGVPLAFRCVLLPLSDDGIHVTHILGAVNGKLL